MPRCPYTQFGAGASGWTAEEMFAKNARDHNYKSEYDELEYT